MILSTNFQETSRFFSQSLMRVPFGRLDQADGRGPVGEGVPQALDAGVVRVERLTEADDVQARLTGQFGQNFRNLQGRFACDRFFLHFAVYCKKLKIK